LRASTARNGTVRRSPQRSPRTSHGRSRPARTPTTRPGPVDTPTGPAAPRSATSWADGTRRSQQRGATSPLDDHRNDHRAPAVLGADPFAQCAAHDLGERMLVGDTVLERQKQLLLDLRDDRIEDVV